MVKSCVHLVDFWRAAFGFAFRMTHNAETLIVDEPDLDLIVDLSLAGSTGSDMYPSPSPQAVVSSEIAQAVSG